jgi:hypothetical protein
MPRDADTVDRAELRERVRRVRATLNLIPVPWRDGEQCLPTALAQCLRLPVDRVPPRCDHEDLDEWDRKVEESLGVRLERIDLDETPAEPWLAIVPGHGENTHAVAVFGNSHLARGRLAGFRIRPS